jgi:hypothetical protein
MQSAPGAPFLAEQNVVVKAQDDLILRGYSLISSYDRWR